MPTEYDRYTKAFHWTITVAILAEYISVWMIPEGSRGPNVLISFHLSFGVLILALMLVRLGWRVFTKLPPPPAGMPSWQVWASIWTHYTLYALLVVLPLSGWLWVSARGWHATLFGLVNLPQLIPVQSALANTLGDVHELVASAVLALVGFHAAAALYHWIIVKDDVMQRMWP